MDAKVNLHSSITFQVLCVSEQHLNDVQSSEGETLLMRRSIASDLSRNLEGSILSGKL